MVRVKNNQIISFNLPETGTLDNGCTVSGYNTLDAEILKQEGWLPLIEDMPTYNPETHHIEFGSYIIGEDKVVAKYIAVLTEIIVPEPQPPTLEERIEATEQAITALMGV